MEIQPRRVDVAKYVKELLIFGIKPVHAKKKNCILARQGILGEKVITWSEKDGEPVQEKVDFVTLDEKTGKPGYVVTKITETGEIKLDAHGHDNTWIVSDSVFQKKYMPNPEMGVGIYKPTGGIQVFIQIQEDIILEQWGKEMIIGRGGYINITNPDDMYGISARDFEDTYKIVSTEPDKVRKITME